MKDKQSWQQWSAVQIADFQKVFLAWYQEEKRQLPWRINTDPYRVWISEIMLQQTRVDTVIDYFLRFMEWFPDIEALAAAPEEQLLKAWEGLGYYSRVRNIQAAARQIVTEYAGKMPVTLAEISSLKGIGPYTAGAIASIAFNLPEPAIDGNVMRVVSRLFLIEADIAKPASRKIFDEAMRKIISCQQPGDFNQALMDLGSSICTPKKPQCPVCPIQRFCLAAAHGQAEALPVKAKKAPPKPVYLVAGIIENREGAFLLTQRPEQGLLANLWTFPLMEVSRQEYEELKLKWPPADEQQLLRPLAAETEEPAIFPDLPVIWQKRQLPEVLHVFSHLKWHVLPFYGQGMQDVVFSQRDAWRPIATFDQIPFPKLQHKIIASWQKGLH